MSKIQLRPYQAEARDNVLAAWNRGVKSVIGTASTGLGKTEIFLSTLAAENKAGNLGRAVILAHRKELIEQPRDRIIRNWSDDLPVPGIVMGQQNDADAKIVCSTVQTLSRRRRCQEVLQHGPITHLILDEAHHAASNSHRAVVSYLLNENPNLRILGVTATPNRSDDEPLDVFDEQVFKYTIKDAIAKYKALVPFMAMGVKLPVDISRVKITAGDYNASQLGSVMDVDNANEIIIETWKKHAADRLTMAFTATVAHAEHLAEAFCKAGVKAEWASANTPQEERAAMIARFKRGETRVLCNVFLWVEGLDVPNISCVIMARPTQSSTVYIQAVGRGLRMFPGKENCLILDFVPNSSRTLLSGNALLEGKPKEQKEREEQAMKKDGTVLEVIGLDAQGNGIDADPDSVIMEALDLFAVQPVAWTFDGRLATAGGGHNLTLAIVAPQDERVIAADSVKAQGQWNPEWDVAYERMKQFSVYVVNGKVEYLGGSDQWDDAVSIAQEFVEEKGDPTLAQRQKKWRTDASTAGQRGMMRRLGIPYKAGMSKGECSQAIAHKLAESELLKLGVIK